MQLLPNQEQERLFFVRSTGLLDTKASEAFDRLTRLAANMLKMPMSAISIVDERRQWFKSRVGIELSETDRNDSFCTLTIESSSVLIVEDSLEDPRFAESCLVTGPPHIRFYAGVPLLLPSGHALGSLCVLDTRPRTFSDHEVQLLTDLAALVMGQIDLHQMAGRVNEVTRLPNRAQLAEDLTQFCRSHPGVDSTFMLVDVMSSVQLQSAVRAVGVAPLEVALRSIATMLMKMLPLEAKVYHVGETRFAVIHEFTSAPRENEMVATVLSQMDVPFVTQGGIPVQLDVHAGLVRFSYTPTETADVYEWLQLHFSKPRVSSARGCGTHLSLISRTNGLLRYSGRFPKAWLRASFDLSTNPSSTSTLAEFRVLKRWHAGDIHNLGMSLQASL